MDARAGPVRALERVGQMPAASLSRLQHASLRPGCRRTFRGDADQAKTGKLIGRIINLRARDNAKEAEKGQR